MAAHPERLLQQLLALVPREPSGRAADAELLRRFADGGDEGAFAALIARHGPMVLGACRRLLRDAGSAEDVAQATFLVLARKAGSVRRPEALAAWLHRIASHLALKQRRADARRRGREARISNSAPPRLTSDLVDELAGRELREAIDEEIERMPERFRLPVVLCCLEGRTLEETGRRLDWTPGSVKGRLERGRAELRDRLVRRGFALTAACAGLDVLREGARASLPSGFGTATLRAAVLFRSGATAGLGNAVAAIAEEGVRGATALTRKVVLSFLLAMGVLGGGVVAVGPPAQPDQPKAKPRAAAAPVLPEKPQLRADRHGDPLPDGAVARLGTVRWQNAGLIQAMAFAPDGKTIASASQFAVRLFDAKGKLTREIRTPDTRFHSLAFSPDGTRLACRCELYDKRGKVLKGVQIWDLGATQKPKEYIEESIQWAGWSEAGEPLAVRQEKDAVVLRELTSGKERRFQAKDLPDLRSGHSKYAYSPAAKLLAFPDSSAAFHVWNVSTGKKLCTLETKSKWVLSVALSPDGRSLACLTSDEVDEIEKRTVQIWDVATGKVRHAVAGDQKHLETVAFTPDGKTLATVGEIAVRFWDASTGRERGRTKGVLSFGPKVAFSPDGKTLATASRESTTALLWDVSTAAPKAAPAGHTNRPDRIDFSPDGKRVVTSGWLDGKVIVWDPTTGEAMTVIRRGGLVRGVAFSADGRSLFSCSTDDKIVVSDSASGRQLHTLNLIDPARKDLIESGLSMRLSGDRKTLITVSMSYAKDGPGPGGLLTAWDAATSKALYRRRNGGIGDVVSPDLRLMALEQGDQSYTRPVRIEDFETGKYRLSVPPPPFSPEPGLVVGGHMLTGPWQTGPLAFSPDGRLLTTWTAAAGRQIGLRERSYTLKVWEVASASEVLSLPTGPQSRVAFSASGRLLAVSAPSQEIVLWDLRRGEELQRIEGFDGNVTSLAFSPDGRRLVSGLADSTLLVWEVRKPKPVNVRPLDEKRLTQAWADLAGDPRKAFAARGVLADSPSEAVALLKKRLDPVRPADADLLEGLLANLDSDSFAAREKARKGLEALDDRATEAFREALRQKPTLEPRRRIEALLRRADKPVLSGHALRPLRAVGVLEDIGTREAQAILETLAGGAPGARLTREAKTALRRMGHSSATGP